MRRFVIVERDVVISEDLSAILSSVVPGAEVERIGDPAQASERLGRRVDLVFAGTGLEAGQVCDLARAARLRGGRLVSLDAGARAASAAPLSMEAPFTSRSVARFIEGLLDP